MGRPGIPEKTNYLMPFTQNSGMDKEKLRFSAAIIAGFMVMVLFAMITVNIMQLIPLVGPFVGGLVAGLIAGKDFLNGAKAGIVAGFLGAVGVALDVMAATSYLKSAVPQFPQVAGVLFLVVALFYFPILAFLGGALGGAIGKKV
jgi:hypothetical protein